MDQLDVAGGRDEPAAFFVEHPGVLGIDHDGADMLAMFLAGCRDAIDGVQALFVEKVSGNTQALAQVAGPDKQQVDTVDQDCIARNGDCTVPSTIGCDSNVARWALLIPASITP